jgi:multidrug resistance efflux pump
MSAPPAPRSTPLTVEAVPGETRPNEARPTEPRPVEPRPAERPAPPVAVPPHPAIADRRRRRRRILLLAPILGIVALVGIVVALRFWYESAYFVMTDNAQVTGDIVQVGSMHPGRIISTRVEIGDQVVKDQELAVVAVPQQVSTSAFGGMPRFDVTGSLDSQAPVKAPFSGVIVARQSFVGSTVGIGTPIYSLVDPGQVYVRANIEETRVSRVRSGQLVDVHADALDRDLVGRVLAVTPASTATFSLLPAQNASGNFIKVTQLVPVRIAVDSGNTMLPLGTSVSVRIAVQDPPGFLWWR